MISEPWKTLLFLIVIPGIVQLIKIIKEKRGAEFSKNAAQVTALLISLIFVVVSGGLAEVALPVLPDLDFGGDAVGAIGLLLAFVSACVGYVGAVWVIVMGLYEAVLEKLFLLIGFATEGAKLRATMRKAK